MWLALFSGGGVQHRQCTGRPEGGRGKHLLAAVAQLGDCGLDGLLVLVVALVVGEHVKVPPRDQGVADPAVGVLHQREVQLTLVLARPHPHLHKHKTTHTTAHTHTHTQ